METLKTLMEANGHNNRKVFYLKVPILYSLCCESQSLDLTITIRKGGQSQSLKVDIEGSELTALPEWIESGALDKVRPSLWLVLQSYYVICGSSLSNFDRVFFSRSLNHITYNV